jgi:hypothetical protein
MIVLVEESEDLRKLNEMFVKVEKSLPEKIENSIFYPKLKQLLFPEIVRFTREKIELRDDLNFFRMNIGENLSDEEIREYLETLKKKYNFEDNDIGLDYHIEVTRFDYGVAVFVVIKRDMIYMKKFVFRFKKANISAGLTDVTQSGVPVVPLKETQEEKKSRLLELWKK